MTGRVTASRLLYGTAAGRALMDRLAAGRFSALAARCLCSRVSRFAIAPYALSNHIPLQEWYGRHFDSFAEFFVRRRPQPAALPPGRLMAPCDGWLSRYPVAADGTFPIKGHDYRLEDILPVPALAARYRGGTCLVFRLCPGDYHHYCYPDDGWHARHHFLPGQLHSVRPEALAHYSVFALNRRSWTLLHTRHFGPVVQAEIGALAVGGIDNHRENISFRQGQEMGCFRLAGSTVLLLLEAGRLQPAAWLAALRPGAEIRVQQGIPLGTAAEADAP